MLVEIGKRSKVASKELKTLGTLEKNRILESIKEALIKNIDKIKENNKLDMENGKEAGLNSALLDRLYLNDERIQDLIDAIDYVISLEDPVGKISGMDRLKNGLQVGRVSVPLGVVGIIYESRPNVTLDCALLCIKSSNALILKGGKEAINSNIAIEEIIREGIRNAGYDENLVQLIRDNDRKVTGEFMKLNEYVDVLIPRGSGGLINAVVENATIPVIKTGEGNCHIFVDESADLKKAIDIIENAKVQRPGACNALESLLVHKNIGEDFYKDLEGIIKKHNLEVYGDENSREYLKDINPATEEDFKTEYLDMAFSIQVVDGLDEALDIIDENSTGHSEAILTENYSNSQKFLNLVDSACVYVNASTRFTDGGQLGMGAEMGISTQKLHGRGPIGLRELTSYKYIILGDNQIRE